MNSNQDQTIHAQQILAALESLRVAMGDRYRAEYEAMRAYWERAGAGKGKS